MLDIINMLAHGFVSIPVILALHNGGLFKYLEKNGPSSLELLAKVLRANQGYLHASLRLLCSLGWLVQDKSMNYSIDKIPIELNAIPKNIISLFTFNMADCLLSGKDTEGLIQLLSLSNNSWNLTEKLMPNFLDGVLAVKIILTIYNEKLVSLEGNGCLVVSKIDRKISDHIVKFFANKNWVELSQDEVGLTAAGNYIFQHSLNLGVVASYAPMLAKIDKLIFGNHDFFFQRSALGFESHIDRKLNVIASGFQHKKFFLDLGEVVLSIFNKEPLDEQPKYIADMGCGDGTLLKYLYEIIIKDSKRGRAIDQYPLTMIALDYNKEVLVLTEQKLNGLPCIILQADISDPEKMLKELKNIGVSDPGEILHVRTFLDHNRCFEQPKNSVCINKYDSDFYDGAYSDQYGNKIPPGVLIANLVEHLQAWQKVVSRHGLVLLEVHSLAPKIVLNFLDKTESLHFDACHAFSNQYLVDAHIFFKMAAEVGLFSEQKYFKKYPRILPYCRITLHHFKSKDYQIRQACINDLPVLVNIEEHCWPKNLRVAQDVIESRINNFPEGQFVLELNREIIGIIYTQRINSTKTIDQVKFNNISSISDRQGKILQLLGIGILPNFQYCGFGGQLLNFVLQYAFLYAGIELVIGVTRAKNFKKHNISTMNDYIISRGGDGRLLDPILHFHESHGADIVKVINDYRSQDVDNNGAGVLIEYKIHRDYTANDNSDSSVYKPFVSNEEELITAKVQETINTFMQKRDEFSKLSDLQDIGLDSLDLMELRALLSKKFDVKIDSRFLLQHLTVKAIAEYFINNR